MAVEIKNKVYIYFIKKYLTVFEKYLPQSKKNIVERKIQNEMLSLAFFLLWKMINMIDWSELRIQIC